MNITLASIFVNSAPTLPRYFAQCVALADALHARGDRLSFLWGEGDSTDNTLAMLEGAGYRIKSSVVDVTHGGQIFGSVVREERFRQLGQVGRTLWAEIPEGADVVLYVESDLIWEPETALGLIDRVGPEVDAIAPPILLERQGWPRWSWYDTYAFVCNGEHFTHRPPWHLALHPATEAGPGLLEMETVGSMLAVRGDYFRKAAQTYDERVIMGLCEDIRKLGGRVWFDPTIKAVIHE